MAFDHPNFMLQFDHESLQDQNTCYTSSHENMLSKIIGQEANEGYSAKPDKIISFNTGKTSSQLTYSPTSSEAPGNVISRSTNAACNEDLMDQMPTICDSEITKYTSYSEMLQDLGQHSKVVLMQYSQVFGDSEAYEQQAYQAVTDLTAHAQLLLQSLNDQKKLLCRRINSISEALRNEC